MIRRKLYYLVKSRCSSGDWEFAAKCSIKHCNHQDSSAFSKSIGIELLCGNGEEPISPPWFFVEITHRHYWPNRLSKGPTQNVLIRFKKPSKNCLAIIIVSSIWGRPGKASLTDPSMVPNKIESETIQSILWNKLRDGRFHIPVAPTNFAANGTCSSNSIWPFRRATNTLISSLDE